MNENENMATQNLSDSVKAVLRVRFIAIQAKKGKEYQDSELPFLHILNNTCFSCCCQFENSHSDQCEVISHCGCDLNFPDE